MHIYISLDQICRRISKFQKTWTYNLDPVGLHISWNVAGSTFVIILVWYYLSHSWEGTCAVRLLFRGIQSCSSYPAPSEAYLWKIFGSRCSKVGWQCRDPETQSSSWGNHYEPRKVEIKRIFVAVKIHLEPVWKLFGIRHRAKWFAKVSSIMTWVTVDISDSFHSKVITAANQKLQDSSQKCSRASHEFNHFFAGLFCKLETAIFWPDISRVKVF